MADFHTALKIIAKQPLRAEAYIPASTIQVHASNLLLLRNGDLLCAWFGGSQEGTSDICIQVARLPKGATYWSSPIPVTDDPALSEQNPVLFLNPATSDIWLFYTAQLSPEEGVFVRQPAIVLKDGTWVLPVWYCRAPDGYRWNGNDDISVVRYSKDDGKTWDEKYVPDSVGCVHMNIKPLLAGSYIAFFRSRWADNIYKSTAVNGMDWTSPTATTLPNPNSGIVFDVLPSGALIMIFHDASATVRMPRREGLYDDITPASDTRVNQPQTVAKEAFWGAPRKLLTVGVSCDLGKTWKTRVLEDGDGFCMTNNSAEKLNRELSYPSIWTERDRSGTVHVAYTFWRQRIKYVRLGEGFVEGT